MGCYAEYRESGVGWLGELPSHWELRRISALYDARNEKVSDQDYPPLSVTMQGIVPQLETAAKTQDGDNRKLVRTGDFVINSRSDRRGACGISEYDGSVTLISNVLAPKDRSTMSTRYYSYLFRSEGFADEFYRQGTGIVDDLWSTNWTRMKNILVARPPLAEQERIADYLDAKTTEIDALVTDCEREVGLLREYRKAVISEAVTKGLDPDTPMKDSGVEWIGKIPEGWLVRPSKTLFAEGKELRRPNDEQCTASQKHGIIPQAQYIALENQRMVAADKNLDAWKHVEPNDFVISLRSFQGGLELSTVAGCITWHYIVLKGNCLVESAYYKYLFKTRKYIESLQRTCTYIRDGQDLRYSNFVQVPLPLPPKIEQVEIGAYLDAKTAEIDSLIDAKQSMADKLREYRRSLISEAVTGKFKVPGV